MQRWIGYLLCVTFGFVSTACSHHNMDEAQGYIEGRLTYLSSNATGTLNQLLVARGTHVKRGMTLFILDQQPESDQLKAAQQNVAQFKAQETEIDAAVALAKITLERNQFLYRKGAVQKATLDAAATHYAQEVARRRQVQGLLAAAEAEANKAQWSQTQKTIVAPVDAQVFDTYYQPGEIVTATHPVLSLLAPPDVKAIFFVPEPQLSALKIGRKIELTCDDCQQSYPAVISFVSPMAEYTPPVIYSEETRSKLVYRIEADIDAKWDRFLHPGQPISVFFPRR